MFGGDDDRISREDYDYLWDENRQLKRELEGLRAALETIAAQDDGAEMHSRLACVCALARAALAQ